MASPEPPVDVPAVAAQLASRRADALQRAPMAVVEHGEDLRVTAWNEGAARLFGYTTEEALGRSVEALVLGGEGGEAWRQAARAGADAGWVRAGARKDGRAVQCEWLFSPLFDERGDPAGAIGFGRDITARVEAEAERRLHEQLFRALLDNLPIGVCAVDARGVAAFHDGKGARAAGLEPGQLVGVNVLELYRGTPGCARWEAAIAGAPGFLAAEMDGMCWDSWYVPLGSGDEAPLAAAILTLDVTQSRGAERELREKLDLIERQQQVIRELSTPIIEVWNKVLTLPMVGVVDSARTAEVMDSLLDAVVRTGAHFAVLDLTGVEAVDTKTAAYLIELVRAVRLLGAEGIITGIRPTVAQTVVALGLDLTSITTLSNLRAGLKYCIVQMNKERLAGQAQPQPAGPAR